MNFRGRSIRSTFAEIAELAALDFSNVVEVRHDHRTDKARIKILYHADLCRENDYKNYGTGENPGDRQGPREDKAIVDVLGEYIPDRRRITIYDEMCRIAAKAMTIGPLDGEVYKAESADADLLKQVVLIHEVAHAVTHLGKERGGSSRIWEYFSYADQSDKELAAQAYSLFYFRKYNLDHHEVIFRKLSEHQSSAYNSWKKYERLGVVRLNQDLRSIKAKGWVGVPDLVLRKLVNWSLGRRPRSAIPKVDMLKVRKLHWMMYKVNTRENTGSLRDLLEDSREVVSSLRGLEAAVYLEELRLGKSQIGDDDFARLSELNRLTRLALPQGGLKDLAVLPNLSGLTTLYLGRNEIDDLSPLASFKGLTNLGLGNNRISDLTALSGLLNLEVLGLAENQIRDLRPISDLTKLAELDVGCNEIGNIAPLSRLTNLKKLILSSNQIKDLAPLSGLTNLTSLSLSYSNLENLAPLSNLLVGMKSLEILHLKCDRSHLLFPRPIHKLQDEMKQRGISVWIRSS